MCSKTVINLFYFSQQLKFAEAKQSCDHDHYCSFKDSSVRFDESKPKRFIEYESKSHLNAVYDDILVKLKNIDIGTPKKNAILQTNH